jgi:hypothetical protein
MLPGRTGSRGELDVGAAWIKVKFHLIYLLL